MIFDESEIGLISQALKYNGTVTTLLLDGDEWVNEMNEGNRKKRNE